MKLYLVRHADALPLGTQGISADEDRPLSDEGYREAQRLAATFSRMQLTLDKILTSPLIRARQTAEELLKHLHVPNLELVACDHLAPGRSSKKLARFLRRLDANHVALVGHEPDLGQHTAWLIGSKRARIEFAKGGVAHVDCDEPPRRGTGALLWLVTPHWFHD